MLTAWRAKAAQVQGELAAFWAANDRRRRLVEALVTQHLPLTAAEEVAWQADAEEWYHSESGVRLDDELRGGLEILLRVRPSVNFRAPARCGRAPAPQQEQPYKQQPVDPLLVLSFLELCTSPRIPAHVQELVSSDEQVLGPMLVAEVQRARATPPATAAAAAAGADAAAALRAKEGVYAAACILEFQLFDYLDFSEWLRGSLLTELSTVRPPLTRASAPGCSCLTTKSCDH